MTTLVLGLGWTKRMSCTFAFAAPAWWSRHRLDARPSIPNTGDAQHQYGPR